MRCIISESKGIDAEQKEYFRKRILAGGPYNALEREAILNYCLTDVVATRQLIPALISANMILTGALIRGEYTKVVASVETAGVPLDALLYQHMVKHWTLLQSRSWIASMRSSRCTTVLASALRVSKLS